MAIFGQGGFCFFFGGSRQLVVPSLLRKMAEGGGRKWLPVHVLAVNPRELTGTALQRGIPPGARVVHKYWARRDQHNVVAVLTVVVEVAPFSCVHRLKMVALVQSRPSSNVDDDELSAPVVVTKATAPALWMCSMICWTRPRPSSTTLATPSQTLQQSLEGQLAQLNMAFHESEGGRGGIHDVVDGEKNRSRGG